MVTSILARSKKSLFALTAVALASILLIANPASATTADGTLDTSFNSGGTGFAGPVRAIAVQPDGKILVGGQFGLYNGVSEGFLVRLHPDGSRDTTFNAGGTGFTAPVLAIALQSDGKIVLGGQLATYVDVNGTHPAGSIARLNADGTFDSTFNAGGAGFDDQVRALVIQSDGKIVVGGLFDAYDDGTSHNAGKIARLDANGTFDAGFTQGSGFDGDVYALTLRSGGIVAGGDFDTYDDGTSHSASKIAPLNADGTFDTTFVIGTGFTGVAGPSVESLATEPSGSILVGGSGLTSYNGIGAPGSPLGNVSRLSASGALDTTFNTNVGDGSSGSVTALIPQPDGKIIVGGAFPIFDGVTVGRIIRLNSNGTADTSFNSGGTGFDNNANAIALEADGNIIVGGLFTSYNGAGSLGGIARLFISNATPPSPSELAETGTDGTLAAIAPLTLAGALVAFGVIGLSLRRRMR